jgi:hypothetical protein
VGGLEAYAGEAGGGGRLEGDHAQDLASGQVTVCQLTVTHLMMSQFFCHERSIGGLFASA